VEQIGSVYETMMGFRLEKATGRSVAVKADKKHGAPTAIDLEALLAEAADKREKFLLDHAGRKISDTIKKNVAAAKTLEDLHAALLSIIDLAASPDLVSKGAMVLQPSEERRRSGSHYTPRSLTEPIVRTTLEPILARLRGEDGRPPRPEQILDLKVCDPAMGCRLNRDRAAGAGPDSGAVCAANYADFPAAWTRPARFVLRKNRSFLADCGTTLSRGCRAGPEPEGDYAQSLACFDGCRRARIPRCRRTQESAEPR
jgi:hypothetical protein